VSLQAEELRRVTWECIHFTGADDAARVRQQLTGGFCVVEMEAGPAGHLLADLGKALRFPDYYGDNWDALDECLRDLEWLPAPGYALFVGRASRLWTEDAPSAGALVESWLLAAQEWGQKGIPFHLVFTW
jgi:hypothetical protein